MLVSAPTAVYQIDVRRGARQWHEALAFEVRTGLTASPKWLPSKLFYDARGSALFEQITALPEYYQTRTERALLQRHARHLIDLVSPRELIELGPGGPSKVRWLLAPFTEQPRPLRYVPLEIEPTMVETTARTLSDEFPFLSVHGIVGDFLHDLAAVPARLGRRLVLFLGGTLGNLHPEARGDLLRQLRRLMEPGDGFLLGLDLVKSPRMLHMAYNDVAGVTDAFNRNILRVVNRHFEGTFQPSNFHHRALYDAAAARIEMHLVPDRRQTVRLARLDLELEIQGGELLWTESSYKFTRPTATTMLTEGGFTLVRWYTDPQALFALALAEPV